MKVLIIGSGGREHALAYGISGSPLLEKLYAAPGNPGMFSLAEMVNIKTHEEILDFCLTRGIDLVIVGPEKPLVEGLADLLRENNIAVFGPNKNAADIEAQKSFAKRLMRDYNIPTAAYAEFDCDHVVEAEEYIARTSYPCVIKADGLAAGKGVIICETEQEARTALNDIFKRKIFGSAGEKIVIEEFLVGEEASVFAITDGEDFICLPSAQDHKRAEDGDKGKNTGGMGAYSPAPVVTPGLLKITEDKIIRPVLQAMKKEGREFSGCLYCGLMINNGEPKVVEFNCRFGDPETQAVIPVLEGDLLKLLHSAAAGEIDKQAVKYSGKCAVCVVAASHGYPEYYDTGFEILGLQDIRDPNVIVFHAGTRNEYGRIVTSGGRVLGLTALAVDGKLKEAKEKAYLTLRKIHYENIYYRTDISDKADK